MKIPAFSRTSQFAALLGISLLPFSLEAQTAKPQAKKDDSPKTHALFLGTDIQLGYKKNMYFVQGVSGNAFIINADGKAVKIPMDEAPVSMKVSQTLRVTDRAVEVSELTMERAYTPENDPRRKAMAAQASSLAAIADSYDIARDRAVAAQLAARPSAMSDANNPSAGAEMQKQANALADANRSFSAANSAQSSGLGNAADVMRRMQEELAEEMYDAMDISFEVSSPRPLQTPFLVITTRFHEKEDARQVTSWVYAKELEPLPANVKTRVKFKQAGFPRGFILDKCQAHFFDKGEELDCNVAEKRVALTTKEAFQYLSIQYMTANKGATKAASRALGRLPGEQRKRIGSGAYPQTYFVKVAVQGTPTAFFVDEACTKPADEEITPHLKAMYFYPALEKGKAVEGLAQVKLSEDIF